MPPAQPIFVVRCYRAGSFVEVAANAVYTFYSRIRMVDGNEYYHTMDKIDGVKQRTESLAGYMIMTNIENGIHHIEMKHRTKGLGVGAVISILAIAGVGVYYRRRN